MCGIIGALSKRNITPILLEGLKRLEYRGYDSAGIAILNPKTSEIQRIRTEGKVNKLHDAVALADFNGQLGIAHTRWATHGKPNELNAHPHISSNDIALVHNGIIENHDRLRDHLIDSGYQFTSETDTEVAVHTIHKHYQSSKDILKAAAISAKEFNGAFALGIFHKSDPNCLIAVRRGSPLVIGIGDNEFFIASDVVALMPVASKFIYLEDGDIARVSNEGVVVFNEDLKPTHREHHEIKLKDNSFDRGKYRHYMLKEIFEQPQMIEETLEGRITNTHVLPQCFGVGAEELFEKTEAVHIVACGTSHHAALVTRYWIERIARIPCNVEVASEYRYRSVVVPKNTLYITISQSGETADTLAALKKAQEMPYLNYLAICNVPESTLVRETEFVFMTRAGMEIGVASTKAFTTQLTSLLLLSVALARKLGDDAQEQSIISELRQLPEAIEKCLALDDQIKILAERFADKHHALFLGRGYNYPIAMEGALKLKEISYIHAEAYPAGELKHGPLALVDKNMPVVAIVQNDKLLEKIKSNLHEVQSRGGELFVFSDKDAGIQNNSQLHALAMPTIPRSITPIAYTIPLQLLAYHVAVIKGTDIDQPRNLAKSVTVE